MAKLPPGPFSTARTRMRYMRDPFELFTNCRERYGDPFTVTTSAKTVLTGDPEGARRIFTASSSYFKPLQVPGQRRVVGTSFTGLSGPPHRQQRAVIAPGLRADALRKLAGTMVEATNRRIETWQPGDVLDMVEEGMAIALDIIIRTVFSVEDEAGIEARRKAIRDFSLALSNRNFLFLSLIGVLWEKLPPHARFLSTRRALGKLLQETIDEVRDNPEGRRGLLADLVAARDGDAPAMADEVIVDNMITMLIAGHETTALSIAWATVALGDAEIRNRLSEEIDPIDVGADPNAVQNLPYLQAFIREVQRYWPPVPDILRVVAQPFELKGWEIPANVQVGACVALTHFDPEIYPEPEMFRPERFIEGRYNAFEFYPFGGGDRVCPGNTFAPMELKIVMALFLKTCRFTVLNETPPGVARTSFLMGPSEPILCRFDGRR